MRASSSLGTDGRMVGVLLQLLVYLLWAPGPGGETPGRSGGDRERGPQNPGGKSLSCWVGIRPRKACPGLLLAGALPELGALWGVRVEGLIRIALCLV